MISPRIKTYPLRQRILSRHENNREVATARPRITPGHTMFFRFRQWQVASKSRTAVGEGRTHGGASLPTRSSNLTDATAPPRDRSISILPKKSFIIANLMAIRLRPPALPIEPTGGLKLKLGGAVGRSSGLGEVAKHHLLKGKLWSNGSTMKHRGARRSSEL
jgi:hypothetical protein